MNRMKTNTAVVMLWLINMNFATAQFPPYSSVDDILPEQAFAIHGTEDSGAYGRGASSIGDFNDDGFDDIIIAARTSDPNGDGSGACYVIFGSGGLLPTNFDLSQLDGSNGFTINGVSASDLTGISVSSAGDINNDGLADLLIGARGVSFGTGAAYIIYGTTNAMPATFELSTLDGNNGFKMMGESSSDWFGNNVSGVGDVNNDQIDDVMIGALTADNNGADSGAVYVVFGRAIFPSSIDVEDLNGTYGFMFNAPAPGGRLGAVSPAGDFNNDGIDDMLMGSYYASPNELSSAGAAYLVFGQDTVGTGINFPATFELSAIDSTTGIVFHGANESDGLGRELTNAGDINHDGIDDIAIQAPSEDSNASSSGAVYVVYGSSQLIDSAINVNDLDGDNGFVMYGENQSDHAGSELAFGGILMAMVKTT